MRVLPRPVRLVVPQLTWDTAIRWEAEILSILGSVDTDYTQLREPQKYRIGFVGELMFRVELIHRHKKFKHHTCRDGRAHAEDFTVWERDGTPKKLDTKTNSRPGAAHLMLPATQFDKHKHDIYVGVRLVGNNIAEVMGWITRDDLAARPRRQLKCLTVSCPYDLLTDIEELFGTLVHGGML